MPQFTKLKTFRIAVIGVLLVGLYALLGFVFAPKLLRNAIMEQIPKQLPGVTPAVGDIHVNPFLFQVEIKDFSLTGAQGTKLAGFERFFIDFELSSLWHRAYTFSRIDISAPFVNAIVAKDGRLNLLQLSPKPSPPSPAEKKNAAPPAVRIGTFTVRQATMSYEDRSRPSDFAARMEPINFELQNFTTGVEGGRFTFTGSSKIGERLEWHGHVSLQPIESDGEFRIDGLQAHTIWEYLADRLNFLVNSGKIDLNAAYKFTLKDNAELHLEVPKIQLSDLTVRLKGASDDWITLPSLTVAGSTVDLEPKHAHVDSIELTGLKVVTWLEADRSLNLLKLAEAPSPSSAQPPPSTPSPTAPSPTAPPAAVPPAVTTTSANDASAPSWTFDLHEFLINGASISAEDRGMKPAAKMLLAPLSVKVEGVSLDLAKKLTFALETKIDESGSLNINGEVTPRPVAANLNVRFTAIDLTAFQPYIAQQTSMTLLGGKLGGDMKVNYGGGKPAVALTGSISVAKLHTVDNALHDDFINWDRLDVQGLNFQHDPDRLDIDKVLVHKAYARVIVEPDATINVKRILAGPGATVTAPAAAGTADAPVTATAAVPARQPKQNRQNKPSRSQKAPAPSGATAPPAMPISIKHIVLEESQANFADLSVKPNFSAGIQKLQGSVAGLSSNPKSRAKVDFHGAVGEFSPVAISGTVNALGPDLFTDLTMSFQNIELSTFNPYSGKFAGYNISKGKLTTEFHYKIDGRKLDAQHHITVEQLEFGEKTESKEAVSLPIKLAVSLLKDKNGVIDLDLPVTGSLDDPKFRIGPIIWKVFVNILEKIVTAPFALLGKLFGGGPDLQFIDFDAGAADLNPAATDKVHTIVKALAERPQLKMEVPIAVVKDLDGPKLVDARFQDELREAQAEGTSRKKPAAASTAPAFDDLEPAARLEVLSRAYAKNIGGEPKFPESVNSIKTKPDLLAAKIDFLTGELRQHIVIGETELTALGQQRAANLQSALLTDTQIAPERVFLVANDKAKGEGDKVRLELTLK
jgi:hypothetical protein